MPSRRMRNPALQVVSPDRCIPLLRSAFENLSAPDVVDQDVDAPISVAEAVGETAELLRLEVVDLDRDADAAELGHELCGLLDRLWPVVVGGGVAVDAAATGADDRRAGFRKAEGDAATGSPGRSGDNGDFSLQRGDHRTR